jgi:putative transposase
MSEEMQELVRGIRFSQPGKSVRAVHQAVCERARELGEDEPSLWQVRSILAHIPEPEQLLADRLDDKFRNRFEVTRRMEHQRRSSSLISYQMDHTLVDVLVKDLRNEKIQTQSGMIRPWLTICVDSRSRLLLAAVFAYDRPNRHTVATAIREAVLVSDHKFYGGIPHEIWVDNGKELLSHHVEQLTQELHIMLQPCAPHHPQQKGIVERFFGTLNTRLWSRQPGYVASNTVERDPNAKAVLTLDELEERFWDFIDNEYHHEVHSQTQETPIEYWTKHCYAEPADPRLLDILLKEPTERTVFKDGIHHDTRIYSNAALATMVDERVMVREEALYRPPDEIEVFSLKKEWICTAIATDSTQGLEVTREDIITAKHEQRKHLRNRIQQAREAVVSTDAEIAAHRSTQATSSEEAMQSVPDGSEVQNERTQLPTPPVKAPPKDLLDMLTEKDENAGKETES